MSTFTKRLRAFAADRISAPGEHKRAEIADAFLDEHPDIAHEYLRELASKKVADLIKDLCDEPDGDPLPIFAGIPAAIAIAPGVVKASANCTLDDLGAGLEYRRQNIRHAQQRFDRYAASMTAYESLRATEAETLGECADRLRLEHPYPSETGT